MILQFIRIILDPALSKYISYIPMELFNRILLKGLSRQEKYYLGLLIAFNFLSVLYQIFIVQELVASFTFLRGRFHIIFGIIPIFYGAGMYLAYKISNFSHKKITILSLMTGLSVIASLGAVLRINITLTQPWTFIILSAGFIFTCLVLWGSIYSLILLYFSQTRKEYIGVLVAYSLVGLVLAFLVRPFLACYLGVNSALVLLGIITALLGIWPARMAIAKILVIAALFALFGWSSLDSKIEGLRDIRNKLAQRWFKVNVTDEELKPANLVTLFDGWSHYSKLNLYQVRGTDKILGCYNYFIAWVYNPALDRRKLMFRFIKPADRVLMLAIGGGWPLKTLPPEVLANTDGVEIDPVIVKFYKDHPEYNDNLFHKTNIIVAEGRNALDEASKTYNVIIADLPGSPATNRENPTEFEDFLFTRESVAKYKALLPDDGVLCYHVLSHQVEPACTALTAEGLYWRALSFVNQEPAYAVYAVKQPAIVDKIVSDIITSADSNNPFHRLQEETDKLRASPHPAMTDDRPTPFSKRNFKPEMLAIFNASQYVMFGLIAFSMLIFALLGRSQTGRWSLPYFFFIGAGLVLFQFYAYAKFRSFFTDPLSTIMMIAMVLFTAQGIGSLAASYFTTKKSSLLKIAVVLLVMVYTYLGIENIPFSISSYPSKLLVTIALIAPFGFISGIYFPLGLLKLEGRWFGWALLMDGVGTAVGFLLFYILYWYLGTSINYLPLAASYILATIIVTRTEAK